MTNDARTASDPHYVATASVIFSDQSNDSKNWGINDKCIITHVIWMVQDGVLTLRHPECFISLHDIISCVFDKTKQ